MPVYYSTRLAEFIVPRNRFEHNLLIAFATELGLDPAPGADESIAERRSAISLLSEIGITKLWESPFEILLGDRENIYIYEKWRREYTLLPEDDPVELAKYIRPATSIIPLVVERDVIENAVAVLLGRDDFKIKSIGADGIELEDGTRFVFSI